MCSGVDSASKNEYQENLGGKDGRCVWVTILNLHCAESHEKSGSLNLPDPQGSVQACSGKTLPLPLPLPLRKHGDDYVIKTLIRLM
jgi:hypothetical protein